MGLRASYQYLGDKELEALEKFDNEEDIFETVEDWNEEAEILLDIDKMWDVLHFVLTGAGIGETVKGYPLSEAVVGVQSVENISEFTAYTKRERIADIINALEAFDIEKAMENFSMEECKNAELYPDIWDYEEEEDEIKEDLLDCFERMKDFYKEVLEADGNVLVTIY